MIFRVFALLAIVQVMFLTSEAELNCSQSLAAHIRHKTWLIGAEKQNIYGNESVGPSIVRTMFHQSSEEAINKQINRELFAHYTYLSMAAHFGRDDIHLPGFAKFFRESAEEEHKHATMLMEYQNRRGGRVKLNPVMNPCNDSWGNGHMAMKEALILEKNFYKLLHDLHNVAEINHDHQLMDFIESKFLDEQVQAIKILANYCNTLARLGDGLGEYQFDKMTLGK